MVSDAKQRARRRHLPCSIGAREPTPLDGRAAFAAETATEAQKLRGACLLRGYERFDDGRVSAFARVVDGHEPHRVFDIGLGAFGEQQLDDGKVARFGGRAWFTLKCLTKPER